MNIKPFLIYNFNKRNKFYVEIKYVCLKTFVNYVIKFENATEIKTFLWRRAQCQVKIYNHQLLIGNVHYW